MLLLFWRGLPGAIVPPSADATAQAETATFFTVRQAVFGAATATATAAIAPGAVGVFGYLNGEVATADAQAPVGALHVVTPIGPPQPVDPGVANFTATNAANLSVPLPTGWQPDDIHVLLAHRSDNAAMTALAGWTQIAALSGNNTTAQRVEVWIRRAVAGDTNPVIVTFGSSTVVRGARIYGIRGCPTTGLATDQIDAQARSDNATADLTIEFPAITTTAANRFLLLLAAFEDDPNNATTPTGFTAPAGNNAGSTLGNDMALIHWTRNVLTAQTITPSVSTVSGGGVGSSPSVGIGMAFKGLLVPAGSVDFPASPSVPDSTATAIGGTFYAEAGNVALLGGRAEATADIGTAAILGGAITVMETAPASAAGTSAVLSGSVIFGMQTATATVDAPASVLLFGASLVGEISTATTTASNPALTGTATFGAQQATSATTASSATLTAGTSLPSQTATATASGTPGTFVAVRQALFVAEAATTASAAISAAFTISGSVLAQTAIATAQPHVGALHVVIPAGAPILSGGGGAAFTATNAANLLVGLPAYLPNDIFVMWLHRSDNTAATAISGWTQIAALSGNNGTAQRVEVWIRRAGSGETDPVPVTFGSGTIVRGGRIVGIRGCPSTGLPTDQIDVQGRSNNAADLSIEFPTLTTTAANRFLLLLAAFEDDPNTIVPPTGFGFQAAYGAASNLGNGMSLILFTRTLTTAQTITPEASTVSGGGVGASVSVGLGIAFKGLLVPAGSVTFGGEIAPATGASAVAEMLQSGGVQLVAPISTATVLESTAILSGAALFAGSTATATASAATPSVVGLATIQAQMATATATAPASVLAFGSSALAQTATATAMAFPFTVRTGAIFTTEMATASTDALPMQVVGSVAIQTPTAIAISASSSALFLAGAVFDTAVADALTNGIAAILFGAVEVLAAVAVGAATAPVANFAVGSGLPMPTALATATMYEPLIGVRATLVALESVATAGAPVSTIDATLSGWFMAGRGSAFVDAEPSEFLAVQQAWMLANTAPAGATSYPPDIFIIAIMLAELSEATVDVPIGDFVGVRETIFVMGVATATVDVQVASFLRFALLEAEMARAVAQVYVVKIQGLFPTVVLSMTVLGYGTAILEPTAYGMVSMSMTAQETPLMGISRDP